MIKEKDRTKPVSHVGGVDYYYTTQSYLEVSFFPFNYKLPSLDLKKEEEKMLEYFVY